MITEQGLIVAHVRQPVLASRSGFTTAAPNLAYASESRTSGLAPAGCTWLSCSTCSPAAAGLVTDSNRGSQYAGCQYRAMLVKHGLDCNMSHKGNCWDNAVAERFS